MKMPSQSGYGVTVSTYGKLDSMSSVNHSPPRNVDGLVKTFTTLPHSSSSSPSSPPVRASARRTRNGL